VDTFESILGQALGVEPGVTSVIGSGGKTTLLRLLAEGLPGTVLLCTSTHIYPFPDLPLMESPSRRELKAAFRKQRVICAGVPEGEKLISLPYPLTGIADYVLVEADGAAGMPIKGHLRGEPPIPFETQRVIQVVGATGIGRRIGDVVHHPEGFLRFAHRQLDDFLLPSDVAEVLTREHLADVVLLNQADEARQFAFLLSKMLPMPSFLSSLQERWIKCVL